jgi:hypothetical protein
LAPESSGQCSFIAETTEKLGATMLKVELCLHLKPEPNATTVSLLLAIDLTFT